MKIAVFHYHLKPGGVTDVIVYSMRSILPRMDNISEVRLVTGKEEGTRSVMSRIRENFDRTLADKLKLDVLDEIAYVEDGNNPDINSLSQRLEARYDEDTLWWIHNYHLGKNPNFTAALMHTAANGNRDMLFHIHDFPECGRHENLRRLDATLSIPPYPSGPRIRYAVINERDKRILGDAGLSHSVTLLSNPVPPPPRGDCRPDELKSALLEKCALSYPGFISGAKNLLYPARTIRRKNILEAGMIAILMDEPTNIIVTLPGVSATEKPYSDCVKRAFASGLIPGVWCPETTGDPRLSYPNLAAGCEGIISTSIQEGFGYLYLNALYWRKPLLARYLDILDSLLNLFGEYPRRFWADFRVPADEELIQRTQQAYLKKIDISCDFIPEKAIKSMRASVKRMAVGGSIDISFLSVDDQLAMLKKANDTEWITQARMMNRELLDSASRTLAASTPDMAQILNARFGDSVFTRTFADISSSFGEKTPSSSPKKIAQSVRNAFGRIDHLRLLYDF